MDPTGVDVIRVVFRITREIYDWVQDVNVSTKKGKDTGIVKMTKSAMGERGVWNNSS